MEKFWEVLTEYDSFKLYALKLQKTVVIQIHNAQSCNEIPMALKHHCINDHPKWVVKVPPLTTPLCLIFPETSQGPIHDQK